MKLYPRVNLNILGLTLIMSTTRMVFVFNKFVVKLPTLRSWTGFLMGLLANCQERYWWSETKDERLCPVLWTLPGGFLLVMLRALPYNGEIFWEDFVGLPVDPVKTNVGVLNGKLVLVDYGS